MPTFSERVFAVVRRIPRGRVASYGLVAELAGSPRAARQVGMVMRLSRGLPWWRVLAKDGSIAIQNPELRFAQHAKLEAEGIRVVGGRVDYERHVWRPRGASRKPQAPVKPSAPREGSPAGSAPRPRRRSPRTTR